MEVWFVLDQYIHDNNLHVLALYPEDSFCSVSRERLEVLRHPAAHYI